MLFRHFRTKQDLYRAILARHLEDMERVMPLRGLAESGDPPRVFFEKVAGGILRHTDGDPALLRLMFHSALEGHPLAREAERTRARGLREAIETYMRRQVRAGRLRRTDARVASRSFVWLVLGWGISRELFREPAARDVPRRTLVRRVVSQFLEGIEAPGAGSAAGRGGGG